MYWGNVALQDICKLSAILFNPNIFCVNLFVPASMAYSLTWINFNPTRISNYIHYKMCDEITYQFPNFNSSLGMDMQFHLTLFQACDYLSMSVKGAPYVKG